MTTSFLYNDASNLTSTEANIAGKPSYSDLFLFLRVWLLLAITVVGLVANLIPFLVIIKSNIKESSIGVYLSTLSVFDSIYLIMTALFHVPSYGFDLNLVEGNKIFCKAYYIIIFVCSLSSAWIIMVMTCERCFIVTNPYSLMSNKILRKRAVVITLIIFVISNIMYIHITVTYDSIPVPRVINLSNGEILEYRNVCIYASEYQYFGSKIFSWMHLAVYSALPTVIILTCNVVIIAFVIKAKKNKRIQKSKSGKPDASNKMTTMLLVNSIFFLITTLPITIYYYWFINSSEDYNKLPWTILLDINLLNYSCNFFIYLLSGKKFRDEAVSLLGCKSESTRDVTTEMQFTSSTNVTESNDG